MLTSPSEKKFVSLGELNHNLTRKDELAFWQKAFTELNVHEGSVKEFELGDLFGRIGRISFLIAVKQLWWAASDFAVLNIYSAHPRHDIFVNDLGYLNALLPETFLELDPQNSILGLHHQIGVRFEIQETQFEFDPMYVDQKIEDLEILAKKNNNVIAFFQQKIIARKSLWVETSAVGLDKKILTPDMEKQLREQYQSAVSRGDLQAASVIQNFLKENNK